MRDHIIIAGGGITGCLSAMALLEQGCRVTLVERDTIGSNNQGGASWAAAGILFPLLPWAYSDAVNRLAVASMQDYPELCARLYRDTGIDPEYRPDGMLLLPGFDREKAQAWAQQYAIPMALPPTDLVSPHWPGEGAVWLPTIGHVRPPRLLRALRAWLQLNGAEVLEHTPLNPVKLEQGARLTQVSTNTGRVLPADALVITGGAWSRQLLGRHADALAIKPMRGQMLLYRQPASQPLHSIVFNNGFYLVPRRDGVILAGSCVEDVGFIHETTPEMAADLASKTASLLPELTGVAPIAQWSGFRPGSPGNVPTIDRHPQISNLYLNTGHFRYGLTMGPASSQVLIHRMGYASGPLRDAINADDYAYPV